MKQQVLVLENLYDYPAFKHIKHGIYSSNEDKFKDIINEGFFIDAIYVKSRHDNWIPVETIIIVHTLSL